MAALKQIQPLRLANQLSHTFARSSQVHATCQSAQMSQRFAKQFHTAQMTLRPISTIAGKSFQTERWRKQGNSKIGRCGSISSQMRSFSRSAATGRDHHFDTLKFVQRLKDEGFTEDQAVAVMKVLSDVIEESILNLTRTMVLREDQEKATYTQKVDFAKLRSELLTADNAESSLTRSSHDRLTNDIAKLNARLRDEVQRTLSSVRLDLNLEKGRIREEVNVQEMKVKETQTRIEQEVAVLKERLETVKFQTLQWLVGVCTGTAALILAAWRLLM